jgi:hypothetical protein
MAKATCVYSTPPTNTSAIDHPIMFPPRDPTRRRFLTVAAGASIVELAALPPLRSRRASPFPRSCQIPRLR